MNRQKTAGFTISVTSLLSGIAIYALLREPPRLLSMVITLFGLEKPVGALRTRLAELDFPNWFLFGLPDFLWMFSFSLAILTIWDFRLHRHSLIWWLICVFIGLAFELLQSTSFLGGVFDPADLIWLGTGAAIPYLYAFKFSKYEKNF